MGVNTLAPNHPPVTKSVSSDPADRAGMLADLREIARELVAARGLLHQLTLRDIRIRYKQAAMGFAWAVLMPSLIVLSGCVIRYAMAQLSGTPFETASIGALALKALAWGFFVGALGTATASLTSNGNLITKVYFPREVLPLSAVLAQGFDSLIALLALALLLPFLGLELGAALVWTPALALLLVGFTVAVALFTSCANLFFRDVKYLVQVAIMFGIFFTPVFFEAEMLGARGASLAMLNPLGPILEGLRLSAIEGHNLLEPLTMLRHGAEIAVWRPWYLGYSLAWTVLGLLGSARLFHRMEFVFAERA